VGSLAQSLARGLSRPLSAALSASPAAGGGVFDPATLFANGEAGDYWLIDAETGTVDATVQNLVGKRGQHTFTQGTAGSRPVLKQRADGVPYLDFASSKTMTVASSQALFNYLHDGSGCTLVALMEWPTGANADNFMTSCGGSTQTGIVLSKSATSQRGNVAICRSASGVLTVNQTDVRMPLSNGRLSCWGYSYKNDGGANDLRIAFDSARDPFYAVTANAPASGNASGSLTLASSWGGKLYALLVINRVLTQAELAALYRGWLRTYNHVLPSIDAIGLLIGQSNQSGRGTLDTTLLPPIDGVYTLPKHEDFVERASTPLHSLLNEAVPTVPTEPTPSSAAVGPGLALGQGIKTGGSKNVLLVPAAVGSTSIAEWDVPADLGDRTKLFGAAVYRALRAKAMTGAPIFIFCVGHEGSASLAVPDYVAGGVGTAYQTAFADFITHLRAALGEEAPLVLAQLGAHTTLGSSVAQAAAGEAQRQLESSIPDCVVIPAHDLRLLADGIHYTGASQATLGARAAVAARELMFSESLTVGPRVASVSRSGAVVTVTFDVAVNASATNYGDLFRVWDNGVEATVSSAVRNADTTKIDITCSATLTGPVTVTYGYRAGSSAAARTDIITDGDSNVGLTFGPLLVAA
jgi:hypothetical protein